MKLLILTSFFGLIIAQGNRVPIVVNTWPFKSANTKAWEVINSGQSAVSFLNYILF